MVHRRASFALSWVVALCAFGLISAGNDDNLARVATYLQLNEANLGLTAADIAELELKDEATSAASGLTHLYLQQQHQGIPVFNGIVNVSLDREGKVVHAGSRAFRNLAQRINAEQPAISPAEAAIAAAKHLGLEAKGSFATVADFGGADRRVALKSSGISRADIPVRLTYYAAVGADVARLAWLLDIYTQDEQHYWQVLVDAVSAAVLDKVDLVANDSYLVYAPPVAHPGVGSRTTQINPADIIYSPYGWHDTNGVAGAEYTDTRGNNTFAQTNTGYRPSGGVSLNFSFPLNLAVNPNTQPDPTVAQLFYITNVLHDVHARYGFDEASGNFQVLNYSGLGVGGDALTARANLTVLNNATMLTPPDGTSPTMNMYIWNGSAGLRNTVFDSLIPIHEFGHGVSNRLTGGASMASCLNQAQAQSMGEGWSDWWGLVMTALPTDVATDARGAGVWVTNSAAGIRVYPYSTDMAINPLTYGDIASLTVPHGAGTVWATTLWDIFWQLVDAYGFDSNLYSGTGGNNVALQLVLDGLKLQPCNPSFLDARDAILQADINNYAGANQCLLWEAFARRGMGFNAYDGGSASTTLVTEDFTVPSTCNADAYIEDTPYDWLGLPDLGHEPEPNMVGAAMWKSRHIWVRNNNDGIYSHQNPDFGQTNYVYARLKNSGPNVSPAHVVSGRVSFWYANASTGLTWPTNWTMFAQIPVANLAAYASRDVVAPFNPPGTGHYCLTAIFESAQDPLAVPLGPSIDANTRANNNEAWRNTNVVDLLPNFTSVVRGIVRNIFHLKSTIRLQLRLTDRLIAGPLNKYVDVRLHLTDRMVEAWRQSGGRLEGLQYEGGTTFLVTDLSRTYLDGITMDANQEDEVKLTFDMTNPLPQAFHLDLVQIQDGKEVGGIAYEVREAKDSTNQTP